MHNLLHLLCWFPTYITKSCNVLYCIFSNVETKFHFLFKEQVYSKEKSYYNSCFLFKRSSPSVILSGKSLLNGQQKISTTLSYFTYYRINVPRNTSWIPWSNALFFKFQTFANARAQKGKLPRGATGITPAKKVYFATPSTFTSSDTEGNEKDSA